VPPLYKVEDSKGGKHYCWNDEELRKIVDKLKNPRITRFKGLGEMNSHELAETTMDYATRKLIRISVPDAADAERVLSTFMGKSVSARKEYLLERSSEGVEVG
jgi:DNA gyrase/topoisomerase IV subunit B